MTRDESPRDILRKAGDVVGGGIIIDIRILDHGNVGRGGTGTLGQRIGGGYIDPGDFGVLRGKMKPNGRIRLDGCTLGASKYSDYRREIQRITGMRVEASPDFNIILPTRDGGGFESRSRSDSTTTTW